MLKCNARRNHRLDAFFYCFIKCIPGQHPAEFVRTTGENTQGIADFFQSNAILTILVCALAWIAFQIIEKITQRAFANRETPHDIRRRVINTSRNTIILFAAFVVFNIWTDTLKTAFFSIAAIGAGLLIVNKELIMNIAGGIHRAALRLYTTGDFIEVGNFCGKVLSCDLTTTLLERGAAGMFTGATLVMPNAITQVDLVLRVVVPTEQRIKHIQKVLSAYYGALIDDEPLKRL